MRHVLVLLMAVAAWSSPAAALEPGSYAVRCSPAVLDGREARIRMDIPDLLTLRQSLGAIISGVSLDSGKRIILIANDRSCALVELSARR